MSFWFRVILRMLRRGSADSGNVWPSILQSSEHWHKVIHSHPWTAGHCIDSWQEMTRKLATDRSCPANRLRSRSGHSGKQYVSLVKELEYSTSRNSLQLPSQIQVMLCEYGWNSMERRFSRHPCVCTVHHSKQWLVHAFDCAGLLPSRFPQSCLDLCLCRNNSQGCSKMGEWSSKIHSTQVPCHAFIVYIFNKSFEITCVCLNNKSLNYNWSDFWRC